MSMSKRCNSFVLTCMLTTAGFQAVAQNNQPSPPGADKSARTKALEAGAVI